MAVAPEMETWDTSRAREEDEHNEKSGDEGNLVLVGRRNLRGVEVEI